MYYRAVKKLYKMQPDYLYFSYAIEAVDDANIVLKTVDDVFLHENEASEFAEQCCDFKVDVKDIDAVIANRL